MTVVEKKLENQVQFWSLLGPFLILLSIAVLLFKVSPHWYFPVSALIGIPLCVKWKMKGLAAALCCLFLLSGIGYQNLDLDDRYWHVGLALTMAFSFIVLTLSLEEVEGAVSKLQLESHSRLENFQLLDEKWKTVENAWHSEKEKLTADLTALIAEKTQILDEKQTFYKLAQLAKDELNLIKNQHDRLIHDLLYKKEQVSQLHERVEEMEATIQGFVNSDSEKQLTISAEQIIQLNQENERLQARIGLLDKEKELEQSERNQKETQLKQSQEKETALLNDFQSFKKNKDEELLALGMQIDLLKQERLSLIDHYTQLLEEKTSVPLVEENLLEPSEPSETSDIPLSNVDLLPIANSSRRIESLYLQLREQFEEKSDILDETRRQLFHADEKILNLEKEREEASLFEQSIEEKQLIKYCLNMELEHYKIQENLEKEIGELTDLLDHLFRRLS